MFQNLKGDFLGLVLFGFILPKRETETITAVTLGSRSSLTLGALRRSFERTKSAHLFDDAFGLHFALEALESTIDRLAFFNFDFWHGRWSDLIADFWDLPLKTGERAGI